MKFEWDSAKAKANFVKHGIDFEEAKKAFDDPYRIIAIDEGHCVTEPRFYCIGTSKEGVLTVRFTPRRNVIRIIGAGYWRKGKKLYEKQNRLQR